MIDDKTTLKDLAFIVSSQLEKHNISAILVGGAVVSIYTDNEYQSYDLDFCSLGSVHKIDASLLQIGFKKEGRHYKHPHSDFFVEFPGAVVVLGNEHQTDYDQLSVDGKTLKLLSPTQSIKDRLAAFYHWRDLQSLDQALMIAKNQKFSMANIKKWSVAEGELTKFEEFEKKLKELGLKS